MKHGNDIVQDTNLLTELAEVQEVGDFAVDMFRNMVHRQLEEKAPA